MRGVVVAATIGMLAVSAALAAWSGLGGGHRPSRPATIGIVQLTDVDTQTFEGFRAGMADLGFRDGETITYDYHAPAGSAEHLPAIVDGMLRRGVDLIFVSSTPGAQAVVKATRDRAVPVVFAPVNDPLAAGIVADLSRPGGRVTGIRLPAGDDLRLDWLTRIVPGVRAVLTPYVPNDKSALSSIATISKVARTKGLAVIAEPVGTCADIQAVIRRRAREVQAIFLPRDSVVESCIDPVVETASRLRLPVAAPSLTQVGRGALFSYGFVHYEIGRRAAHQVSQVLRGVSPGDLPVEAAESYLAINTAAAAAIGLPISDEILVLADIIKRD